MLTHTQDYRTADRYPQEATRFSADRVVLALPRRSLELIEWRQWSRVRYRDAVLKQTAFKVFLGYHHPWWRELGLYAGHSVKRELPEPYDHLYHDWSEDPFGGGWHGWKAGVCYHEAMPRMRKPLDDEQVYICGSAYSNMHGWVEGALQTAELVLEDHFGLDRPAWLDPGYRLGP